jgi:hypothetical protein
VVVAAFAAGWWVAGLLEVQIADKTLSGLEWQERSDTTRAGAGPGGPFALRLVDAGGVGIPADTASWGTTYSHATRAFADLLLESDPWIDPERRAAVVGDWRRYLRRMHDYGSNGVVVEGFLELLTLDRLEGPGVYSSDDPRRRQHEASRALFVSLIDDARALGMDVYLKTDLPAVTPALARHMRTELPGAGTGDAEFWQVYAAAFDELFERLPGLAGVVVRIGEGGPLFSTETAEPTSYVGVREPEQLRVMLRTLLPVFERHGRSMVLRTWSVGVGALGDLHNDPEVYRRALEAIDSPALIVSTKFVQGDYFGFLPLNPTLLTGRHRRLVEMQARREYEGFGALPNYLGYAHARALAALQAANPNIVGTFLWTQEGGPLRAGPLSLYEVAGFWTWTDANVYATSKLALDPGADPSALAEAWVEERFGDSPDVVRELGSVLETSREALEKALYVRPYARRRVEIAGVDAPPILQVFEWDVLAGWSSVLATLYRSVSDDVETPIEEGYEALALAERMSASMRRLAPELGAHPEYATMVRSLEYQESLFRVLADFRGGFLRYYQWLDHGGDEARWREAMDRFESSARAHQMVFGQSLDFPAFDVAPALGASERALSAARSRGWARAVALVLAALLAAGAGVRARRAPGTGLPRVVWLALVRPDRLGMRSSGEARGAAAAALAALCLSTALLAPSPKVALGVTALAACFALALRASWNLSVTPLAGRAHASASLGPLLLLAAAVCGIVGVRGPDYFWYLFWTEDGIRSTLFGTGAALLAWCLVASFRLALEVSRRPAFAGGSVLLAGGCTLFALTLLLPDIQGTLAALDDPLHLLPMRPAIINGVTQYAGVSDLALRVPAIVGVGLMLLGTGLQRSDRGATGARRARRWRMPGRAMWRSVR